MRLWLYLFKRRKNTWWVAVGDLTEAPPPLKSSPFHFLPTWAEDEVAKTVFALNMNLQRWIILHSRHEVLETSTIGHSTCVHKLTFMSETLIYAHMRWQKLRFLCMFTVDYTFQGMSYWKLIKDYKPPQKPTSPLRLIWISNFHSTGCRKSWCLASQRHHWAEEDWQRPCQAHRGGGGRHHQPTFPKTFSVFDERQCSSVQQSLPPWTAAVQQWTRVVKEQIFVIVHVIWFVSVLLHCPFPHINPHPSFQKKVGLELLGQLKKTKNVEETLPKVDWTWC